MLMQGLPVTIIRADARDGNALHGLGSTARADRIGKKNIMAKSRSPADTPKPQFLHTEAVMYFADLQAEDRAMADHTAAGKAADEPMADWNIAPELEAVLLRKQQHHGYLPKAPPPSLRPTLKLIPSCPDMGNKCAHSA